jgi:hypothetical protein
VAATTSRARNTDVVGGLRGFGDFDDGDKRLFGSPNRIIRLRAGLGRMQGRKRQTTSSSAL